MVARSLYCKRTATKNRRELFSLKIYVYLTLAQNFGKASIVRSPMIWCLEANLLGLTWQCGQGSFWAYSRIFSAVFNVRSKVLRQLWHLNIHVVHLSSIGKQ